MLAGTSLTQPRGLPSAFLLPDPPTNTRPRWIHTDLLAENNLIRHGRLAAVLDFGALAIGHPSVDQIGAWELLGARDRDVFRSTLNVDGGDWVWGRAWAFAIAVMTFPYYWHTMPTRCATAWSWPAPCSTTTPRTPDQRPATS